MTIFILLATMGRGWPSLCRGKGVFNIVKMTGILLAKSVVADKQIDAA